jgi:hypothetical protein
MRLVHRMSAVWPEANVRALWREVCFWPMVLKKGLVISAGL